jgi:hypothetical protein
LVEKPASIITAATKATANFNARMRSMIFSPSWVGPIRSPQALANCYLAESRLSIFFRAGLNSRKRPFSHYWRKPPSHIRKG